MKKKHKMKKKNVNALCESMYGKLGSIDGHQTLFYKLYSVSSARSSVVKFVSLFNINCIPNIVFTLPVPYILKILLVPKYVI